MYLVFTEPVKLSLTYCRLMLNVDDSYVIEQLENFLKKL